MGLARSGAIAREKRTVEAMVLLYCADHHEPAGRLCPECRDLLAYSHARLDGCRYGEQKPTCKACPTHCYRRDRREAMQVVMRYAGPRMILRHPWLALVHMWKERRGAAIRPMESSAVSAQVPGAKSTRRTRS